MDSSENSCSRPGEAVSIAKSPDRKPRKSISGQAPKSCHTTPSEKLSKAEKSSKNAERKSISNERERKSADRSGERAGRSSLDSDSLFKSVQVNRGRGCSRLS